MLCQHLSIEQLAIEYSHSIDKFIQNSVRGSIDFSLLNTEMFDTSILSIEMLKTIVELLRLGIVHRIIYIDETFDYTEEQWRKITDPDWREIVMAREIRKIDVSRRTFCMTGSWHAQPRRTAKHTSALCRVRESNPETVLIQNVYRSGEFRNSGKLIKLPSRNDLPNNYEIIQKTKRNFALVVPEARAIESATTRHPPPTG